MKHIRAYSYINHNLATSGQPSIEQFYDIAAEGYSVVVNLALASSDFALANERDIVESQGMQYVHIPVSWDAPKQADVDKFFATMKSFSGHKIWVHCALNMRASCFVYLYNICILKISDADAALPMSILWQPSGVWAQLIAASKVSYQ